MWDRRTDAAVLAIVDKPVDTIDDVIARQLELMEALSPLRFRLTGANPVAQFNELYLGVTRAVQKRLGEGRFRDPVFMERLDVEFGKLYFAALRSWVTGGETPPAWVALFERRSGRKRLTDLDGALLGVNAHINHDLTFALVEAHRAIGPAPTEEGATDRKIDYDEINEIFREQVAELWARVIGKLFNRLKRFLLGLVNRALGSLDEALIIELIVASRQRAWNWAAPLWDDPDARRRVEDERPDLAGLLARVILISPFYFLRTDRDPGRVALYRLTQQVLGGEVVPVEPIEGGGLAVRSRPRSNGAELEAEGRPAVLWRGAADDGLGFLVSDELGDGLRWERAALLRAGCADDDPELLRIEGLIADSDLVRGRTDLLPDTD